MKRVLVTIVLAFGFTGIIAQVRINPNPAILVDSVFVPYNMISVLDSIGPNNIKELRVDKSDKKYPNGAIYVTLKGAVPQSLKGPYISLQEITNKNISAADKGKPVIYVLDGKLLTDTTYVRLPVQRPQVVTVYKASETPYFSTAMPNALLLMISTKLSEILIR